MPIDTDIEAELQRAHRHALLQLVRSNPEMTLTQLGGLVRSRQGRALGALTVGDLIRGDAGSRVARTGRVRAAARGADTRTASGRAAFDAAVLAAVEGADGWIGAGEIRAQTGGTPQQVRVALARMIESGQLKWKGRARATKYAMR